MEETPSTWLKQAISHHHSGALTQAEALYIKVLEHEPNQSDALHFLGILASQKGQHEQAVNLINQAICVQPTALMYAHRANALQAQQQYQAAIDSYQQAIKLQPQFFEAYANLGIAYRGLGQLDAAIDSYQRAIAINPDYAPAYNSLGSALKTQGKLNAAVESYRHALRLNPQYADAYNNLANAYQTLGRLNEAVTSYRQALALNPHYTDVYSNLGNALQSLGQYQAAIDSYRQALVLQPNAVVARSNLLFALSFYPQCTPSAYLAEARHYGELLLAQAQPYQQWPHSQKNPARLRVALLSGDLKTHPVGYFIESILAHLNANQLEVFVYSTQPFEDELTQRIKQHISRWQTVVGLTDAAAAHTIHHDGIDVLIDLAGHTAHNRLPILAWKPAPLQISWLGFFSSTGVIGIDYLLADPLSVLASQQAHFSEKIWYLPETRLCFTPPSTDVDQVLLSLPALKNGYITFGCFQKLAKINDDVLTLWGRIFKALPQARLRLQSKQMNCPMAREQLLSRLSSFGINKQHVEIMAEVPRAAYLAAYAEVDMILDTFPFTGGTTTCEALWMGVPTLTLTGNTLLARQGVSLLSAVGLHEWIAADEQMYVDKAISYAQQLPALAQLRTQLRSMLQRSPLVDAPRFARHFSYALQSMWREKMGI